MIRRGALGVFAVFSVAALALAACGGDDSSNSSSNNTTAATTKTSATNASGTSTVSIKMTDLGDTLVTADGRTLYIFKSDSKGKSNCNTGCDSTWPPLA